MLAAGIVVVSTSTSHTCGFPQLQGTRVDQMGDHRSVRAAAVPIMAVRARRTPIDCRLTIRWTVEERIV